MSDYWRLESSIVELGRISPTTYLSYLILDGLDKLNNQESDKLD